MVKKIVFMAAILSIISCQEAKKPTLKSEIAALETVQPLDTIVQISREKDWVEDKNQIGLRLDSILSDSRCPPKVQCIWAGNAEIAVAFKYSSSSIFFKLNTHLSRKDTIIENFQISLLELSRKGDTPYMAKCRIRDIRK